MIVPTVERGFWPDDFCEIEIDGLRPADMVDVGLGHLPQELPGKARQAFDVAPLAFGIQRVEGQRAFARPADAGQANQLVAGQDQIDVPQVVFAGAFDDDIGSGHGQQTGEIRFSRLGGPKIVDCIGSAAGNEPR